MPIKSKIIIDNKIKKYDIKNNVLFIFKFSNQKFGYNLIYAAITYNVANHSIVEKFKFINVNVGRIDQIAINNMINLK
jgi:hypothetical protein